MINTKDKVIVNIDGKYEIGVVMTTYKRAGGNLYNVLMESGTQFSRLLVDNQKSMIFIDSKYTKSIIKQLNVNT